MLLPSVAQSLAVSRLHGDGLCDAEALYKAHQVGSDWKALKGNPCMSDEVYDQLESGLRDPDDNAEFLGDLSADELVDVDVVPSKIKVMGQAQRFQTKWPPIQFLGIPHSGSSSLAQQLNLHPQLSYGLTKEHKATFNIGKTSNEKLKKAYESTFPLRNITKTGDETSVKYTFDASPDTIFIGCPNDQRMHHLPIGKKYGGGKKAVTQVH